ncbi:unnamed protein product [Auanema sp. JU1783]|nr:unnamed protein product [Auanema sp. JU1783]
MVINCFSAPKYSRLLLRFLLGLFCFLVIIITCGLTVFDRQHNNIIQDYMAREDDMVILSATFFKNSTAYKPNTVVLLLNAHQVFYMKYPYIFISYINGSNYIQAPFKIEQVIGQTPFYCKWVPYLAIGQVPDNATSVDVLNDMGNSFQINLRTPYNEEHDVVVCFTPLFMNEKWQLMLLSAEVYTHYGAFMHFYVRSMITDLFELLTLYKNSRITAWPGVRLGHDRASGPTFDPNLELEFRNQASAMTDCLLRYKESAKYIIFPDPDDIIIPRLGDRTYFGEFQKVFVHFPNAAVIAYNMSQAALSAGSSPESFSIPSTLKSIHFKGETRWGKLVVKPSLVDSVWIHESYGIKKGYTQYSLPVYNNSIIHLRYWKENNGLKAKTLTIPKYDPLLLKNGTEELIPQKDIDQIERTFATRMQMRLATYQNMSSTPLYYPLIEKCYNRIFYNGEHHGTCKGPELCDIPSFPGVRCVNVINTFETLPNYNNIYVHHLLSYTFEQSYDGCRV